MVCSGLVGVLIWLFLLKYVGFEVLCGSLGCCYCFEGLFYFYFQVVIDGVGCVVCWVFIVVVIGQVGYYGCLVVILEEWQGIVWCIVCIEYVMCIVVIQVIVLVLQQVVDVDYEIFGDGWCVYLLVIGIVDFQIVDVVLCEDGDQVLIGMGFGIDLVVVGIVRLGWIVQYVLGGDGCLQYWFKEIFGYFQ